jgi:hypothetical protein
LSEISIVRRGAVKGAEITNRATLKPAPVSATRPAAVRSCDRAAAGEVFYGGPVLIRPGIGQVLGVR